MNNKDYAETQKYDDPQTGLIGQLEFIGVQLERIARALEDKKP